MSREIESIRKREQVSKENRQEYRNEKRIKELFARGKREGKRYDPHAIGEMMKIPEHQVERMLKHKSNDVILDGKL